ncbi:MAG: hypothetical protein M1153_02130 [Patescibacteria group bacterium]|nr:hypothetical protein [Patescibacteria group bacterium]
MNKIKAVEEYGRLYLDRILKQQIADKESICKDWYEALKFFFSKSFYRGRKDELSERFMQAALKTLEESRLDKNFDRAILDNRLSANGVNNGRDRQMVLETLDFIYSLESYGNNIVKYTLNLVKEGKIKDVFQTLDKIFAIGDKLAALYLRDVVLIYDLEKLLKPDEFKYCQPIDTWVKQAALKLGIISLRGEDTETIKSAIIKSCFDDKVSPLLFNAGAWMVGAKSFELLIEKL